MWGISLFSFPNGIDDVAITRDPLGVSHASILVKYFRFCIMYSRNWSMLFQRTRQRVDDKIKVIVIRDTAEPRKRDAAITTGDFPGQFSRCFMVL